MAEDFKPQIDNRGELPSETQRRTKEAQRGGAERMLSSKEEYKPFSKGDMSTHPPTTESPLIQPRTKESVSILPSNDPNAGMTASQREFRTGKEVLTDSQQEFRTGKRQSDHFGMK